MYLVYLLLIIQPNLYWYSILYMSENTNFAGCIAKHLLHVYLFNEGNILIVTSVFNQKINKKTWKLNLFLMIDEIVSTNIILKTKGQ